MAKKFKELAAKAAKGDNQFVQSVRDSAQQIWLAGLGAFSKAQAEGGKAFESLVKEGATMHKKTRGIAEAKVAEVTGNVSKVASRAQSAATETWDKLEQVFEDRVARASSGWAYRLPAKSLRRPGASTRWLPPAPPERPAAKKRRTCE